MASTDRVQERRRAAALARYYRDEEGLSIVEIARRLGRAPATIKAYLYDPTGEKARAVKARYVGVLPRLRRLHPAAQRQGRRLRVVHGLPSRRDPGALDPRARASGDAPRGPAAGWLTSTSATPIRARWLTSTSGSLFQVVQGDNAETDELRARNASESSHAGSTVAHGCFWAKASVR